ncbi:hypothetical protein [Listonella phage phiHSIC]|uniref:hypothetical protein n=1 Tax=Listonella phage phiHSIC TaxID=310539 RepID=UPI00004C7406|nr:hypothetical protein LPPPVgp13 [Listonella phage phiHSIC]AAW67510.1 hypothetical protein [Listonella phage phiHSIC]
MKMSDYFDLPVSDDFINKIDHSQCVKFVSDGVAEFDAAVYAINNYDRLLEENAKLRKILERLVNPENCKKDIIHIIGNAESLLNQLKEQNNDK